MAYTYEDFERLLNESGLGGNFSSYDMELARANPDAGVGIISAKQGYNSATSDADRAMYNQQAESLRSQYGNYTGGQYGLEYNPLAPKPTLDTQQTARPTYTPTATYTQTAAAPTPYVSTYSEKIDALLSELNDPGKFEYDYKTDPGYSAYKKEYTREGDRAMRDTLAESSAMTNGLPSSYALSAAQQANQYYGSRLADKIPELRSIAYDMWQQQLSNKRNALSAYQSQDNSMYGRYRDTVGDYQTDRAFDRNVYESDRAFDWTQYQDANASYESDRSYDAAQQELEWNQAYNKWLTSGVADATVAKVLGVNEGDKTADYALNMLSLAGKSGGGSGGGGSGSGGGSTAAPDATLEQQAYYNRAVDYLQKNFGSAQEMLQYVASVTKTDDTYKRNMGEALYNYFIEQLRNGELVQSEASIDEDAAYKRWKALGYADASVAAALGVGVGTYYDGSAIQNSAAKPTGGTGGVTNKGSLSDNEKLIYNRLASMLDADFDSMEMGDKETAIQSRRNEVERMLDSLYRNNSISYEALVFMANTFGIQLITGTNDTTKGNYKK